MSTKKKVLLKNIIVGDQGVGKTCLLNQQKPTIGADFLTKEEKVEDKQITMQLWDTAGQEKFQTLGVTFQRGAECCVLVFDLTNMKSFETLESWREEFLKFTDNKDDKFPFVVIGNKSDKVEERKVPSDKARQWAEGYGYQYFECSAKDNHNVAEAFKSVAKVSQENAKLDEPYVNKKQHIKVENQDNDDEDGGCGC